MSFIELTVLEFVNCT